ncbi:hypothetical protein MMIC_P1653 [Mariprofundus micogutta]|uniref:Uncharacterized protein n=1 Tax=Mariprofundus micogutta TaxID=1921010 RepID=A0A1L8CP35_9PROT|nr:hypothetical protein MMIC_P1653 [Mariprofundus micogutta]
MKMSEETKRGVQVVVLIGFIILTLIVIDSL